MQAVFQDPFSAFNQFFTIRAQLKSSFKLFEQKPSRDEIEARVDAALLAVNIQPKEIEGKYPFELSGGQMQRMLLARIFILRPEVLIADEPTSMVDACSRASILDYLLKLKKELDMTIVFVTHDIGLACYISRLDLHHAPRRNRRTRPPRPRNQLAHERRNQATPRGYPGRPPRMDTTQILSPPNVNVNDPA